MRKNTKTVTNAIADLVPALMSGTELEFFSQTNITNSQFITLMAVFYSGKCTMGHVARSLHVTMPTVTGLADRLIKLNLMKRSTSEKDRRKVYIELSKSGKALIRDFKCVVRRRWSKVLATLEAAELKSLQAVLKKLNRNIKSQKDRTETRK